MQSFLIAMFIVVIISLIYAAVVKDKNSITTKPPRPNLTSQEDSAYTVTKEEGTTSLKIPVKTLEKMYKDPEAYPELQDIFRIVLLTSLEYLYSSNITINIGGEDICRNLRYSSLTISICEDKVEIC